MAIAFTRITSSPATLVADLRTAILASTDWSDLGIQNGATTLTAQAGSYSSSFTVASTAGMAAGMHVLIGGYLATISAVTNATQFTTTSQASSNSIPNGSIVAVAAHVLQTTTTDGEVFALNIMGLMPTNGLFFRATRGYGSAAPSSAIDAKTVSLFWRQLTDNPVAMDTKVYLTVSAGKDHLYVSLEGPRPGETGASHTQDGSARACFFMSSLVRYHDADVPAVVIGGSNLAMSSSMSSHGLQNYPHIVYTSRAAVGAGRWTGGVLASLVHPGWQLSSSIATENVNRKCSIDGAEYLLPYVLFDQTEGMRGRLSRFFFTGFTHADQGAVFEGSDQHTKYGGVQYVSVAPIRGANNMHIGSPFGMLNNQGGSNVYRSVLVAVPRAEAV